MGAIKSAIISRGLLFFNDSSPNLRDTDIAAMAENAKNGQQPHDDADYNHDVENFFNFPVHRDIGIDQPEQHADDDQSDDDRRQWHGVPWVLMNELIFMV